MRSDRSPRQARDQDEEIQTKSVFSQALKLLVPKEKYIFQAFRGLQAGPSAADPAACASWMHTQCARPANESAVVYGGVSASNMSAANLSLAGFLGPSLPKMTFDFSLLGLKLSPLPRQARDSKPAAWLDNVRVATIHTNVDQSILSGPKQ